MVTVKVILKFYIGKMHDSHFFTTPMPTPVANGPQAMHMAWLSEKPESGIDRDFFYGLQE